MGSRFSEGDPRRRLGRMTQQRLSSSLTCRCGACDRRSGRGGYRAQGAPSRDVGLGRLSLHGRDVPLPLGPRLVAASGIGPGMRVLDVAAGTGNASIPAAAGRRRRHRQRPHARAAGGRTAQRRRRGLTLEWVEADAEHLPFDDESFDVVMSSIGAMFAPHHQDTADELVARLPSRRHDRAAELDPGGHDRRASGRSGRSRRRRRPARSPRRCGAARRTCSSCSATGVDFVTPRRDVLRDHGLRAPARLRRALQGPLWPDHRRSGERTRQRARRGVRGGAGSLLRRLEPRTPERARFELQYLLAVGTRT